MAHIRRQTRPPLNAFSVRAGGRRAEEVWRASVPLCLLWSCLQSDFHRPTKAVQWRGPSEATCTHASPLQGLVLKQGPFLPRGLSVHPGCWDKTPHTKEWRINTSNSFLIVWRLQDGEASRFGVWEDHFWGAGGTPWLHPHRGRGAPGACFIGVLTLFQWIHPHTPVTSQGPHLPMSSH